MIRTFLQHPLTAAVALGYLALGCESGGVGDPCIPEDEYRQGFSGFAETEVNVESRSFQCETRVCIVNHFQGRVSCPYGQDIPPRGVIPSTEQNTDAPRIGPPGDGLPPADATRCRVPGSSGEACIDDAGNNVECLPGARTLDAITVPVNPQKVFRAAEDTVYCSCRCRGPDEKASYCECPSGFACEELVREIGVPGRGQLVGSYCIKPNTKYDPTHPPSSVTCQADMADSNPPDGNKRRNVGDTCGRNAEGDPANPPL